MPIDYVMLRGIFMPAGVTKEQVDYYVDLFKKVRETAGVEEVHGGRRVQHDVHDRRANTRNGSRRRRTRTAS